MLELHVILQGRVQGIGLRNAAARKANELYLTGYVKNLYDGTVELLIQGEDMVLSSFLQYLSTLFDFEITSQEYRTAQEVFTDFRSL